MPFYKVEIEEVYKDTLWVEATNESEAIGSALGKAEMVFVYTNSCEVLEVQEVDPDE